jgi:nardilysin
VSHVDARIEAFLKRFSKMLKNMKGKELEEVSSSLIKLKQLSDLHLKEEVSRNWDEITSGCYMFDRLEREVSVVPSLKLYKSDAF